MQPGERWDGDVRRTGAGDASTALPALRELLDLAARPGWVAEDPDLHLEEHVRRAADVLGLTVTAVRTTPEGSFEVGLAHDPSMTRRAVRVAAWGVVAAVAETTTHGRETDGPDGPELHVVTGVPGTPDGFAPHGHHLVLRLAPRA